jgi:hypothetical protein
MTRRRSRHDQATLQLQGTTHESRGSDLVEAPGRIDGVHGGRAGLSTVGAAVVPRSPPGLVSLPSLVSLCLVACSVSGGQHRRSCIAMHPDSLPLPCYVRVEQVDKLELDTARRRCSLGSLQFIMLVVVFGRRVRIAAGWHWRRRRRESLLQSNPWVLVSTDELQSY